ncbi:MAG: amidohydrolase [SAR202 cluster bacterium Io17-Chloro-G4]|nr:MAG: amidohydrolase [SAR202 cluster bacterium Io17-Chloro-G4]
MDLILRNAVIAGEESAGLTDIGIDDGRIAVVQPGLSADGAEIDLGGNLVAPGFVETHIHLDKSCILDRCHSEEGNLEEAIAQVAAAKQAFTEEDVAERARRTLDKCVLQGTTHIRTHVEVDPVIGLRSLIGILPLVKEYEWALDLDVCVFPQEGLLNNPGTDELMVEGLRMGAKAVGAAPYTDTDPHGQIDRVFEMAREFDVDIDMHLDFGADPADMDVEYVCQQTQQFGYGGRVAVGHVTKFAALPEARFEEIAERLASAGVAVTVLPSTDLFLMGRDRDHNVVRGVTPAHKLLKLGVNCSLSSNNVLDPFTPFGDCSLVRMANLYANVCHVGTPEETADCFEMVTRRSAKLLRLEGYDVDAGNRADLVVLQAPDRAAAVSELAAPLYGFKHGRQTFIREAARLHRP